MGAFYNWDGSGGVPAEPLDEVEAANEALLEVESVVHVGSSVVTVVVVITPVVGGYGGDDVSVGA